MTLNLVIVSPKNVYQCSDFRLLYRNGTVTDHEAQKIVPIYTYSWRALVQFTGVAKTSNFDMSQWLANLQSQVSPTTSLKWLKDKLLSLRKDIGVSEPHTFSGTGFEDERPFLFLVSNCERFDDMRGVERATKRSWEVTSSVRRHAAFATGSGASHVKSDDLRALRKVAHRNPIGSVHRNLAELNRIVATRAGPNGPISESCCTGQMSPDGEGSLIPHNVNLGGEYLPKFVTNLLPQGTRLQAKTDNNGNPLPRRLVQIGLKTRNTPFPASMFICEFSNVIEVKPVPPETASTVDSK